MGAPPETLVGPFLLRVAICGALRADIMLATPPGTAAFTALEPADIAQGLGVMANDVAKLTPIKP